MVNRKENITFVAFLRLGHRLHLLNKPLNINPNFIVIVPIMSSKISSTLLVNCLPNGTIQTVNSIKYPTREIKTKLGIDFKYHYLRHTYGTRMAELNTPEHLLCDQMGHGNIHVTQRYYLAVTKSGVDVLRDNLNSL